MAGRKVTSLPGLGFASVHQGQGEKVAELLFIRTGDEEKVIIGILLEGVVLLGSAELVGRDAPARGNFVPQRAVHHIARPEHDLRRAGGQVGDLDLLGVDPGLGEERRGGADRQDKQYGDYSEKAF